MADHLLWQTEAKRIGGEAFVDVVVELQTGQKEIMSKLDTMEQRHDTAEAAIAIIRSAFPSGDMDGHRRYHQLLIDNTESKRALTKAIKEKTYAGLAWSLVVWLASELWAHLPDLSKLWK